MSYKDILVSVIIPVYNVEAYLSECVNSVLNQTYRNIEVILVDDGSPDNCPQMCDEFALKDSRVKVVHKDNGGLSSARNAGIKVSTGEYIMFLDSDDYWSDNDVLEGVVNTAMSTNSDIVCFGYKEYFSDKNTYAKGVGEDALSASVENGKVNIRKMFSYGVFVSSSCVKAVKADVIKDNSIYFVEKITSEDVDWSARLLLKTDRITVFPRSFYIYRQREGSIVHTIKYENLKMLAENIERCLSYSENVEDEDLLINYNNYVAYQYICFLRVALLCENDPRTKELLKDMKKYRWLLKYNLNKKVKIVYLFNKFLGYKLMFKALKLYSKVK